MFAAPPGSPHHPAAAGGDSAPGTPDEGAADDTIVETRGLTRAFEGSFAVKSPSLPVRRGSIHALIGPNGAGETTTLESIMGIVPRREGSIAFESGETIRLASIRIARRGIA